MMLKNSAPSKLPSLAIMDPTKFYSAAINPIGEHSIRTDNLVLMQLAGQLIGFDDNCDEVCQVGKVEAGSKKPHFLDHHKTDCKTCNMKALGAWSLATDGQTCAAHAAGENQLKRSPRKCAIPHKDTMPCNSAFVSIPRMLMSHSATRVHMRNISMFLDVPKQATDALNLDFSWDGSTEELSYIFNLLTSVLGGETSEDYVKHVTQFEGHACADDFALVKNQHGQFDHHLTLGHLMTLTKAINTTDSAKVHLNYKHLEAVFTNEELAAMNSLHLYVRGTDPEGGHPLDFDVYVCRNANQTFYLHQ